MKGSENVTLQQDQNTQSFVITGIDFFFLFVLLNLGEYIILNQNEMRALRITETPRPTYSLFTNFSIDQWNTVPVSGQRIFWDGTKAKE